jgi:hypothetical protein
MQKEHKGNTSKRKDEVELFDKKRKSEMWNQRNSKVTEEYLKKLLSKGENLS